MRVIIMGYKPVFSEINRKEEITPETYLLTDKEEHDIRETLEKGGEVYVTADKRLVWTGAKPDEYYTYDKATEAWVVDDQKFKERLEQYKADLWEKTKAERETRLVSGCYVPSIEKWFHTDMVSQMSYTRALEFFNLNPEAKPVMWKTMDGSFVEIGKDKLIEVISTIFIRSQEIFKIAETHGAKIRALTSLDSYDIMTGWPSSFSKANNNE